MEIKEVQYFRLDIFYEMLYIKSQDERNKEVRFNRNFSSLLNHVSINLTLSNVSEYEYVYLKMYCAKAVRLNDYSINLNYVKNQYPELDAIGRDTVKRVISVIPGGNMINMLSGTLLGSGIIIKNCIGVTGMLLIIFVVAFPVIRIFILMH